MFTYLLKLILKKVNMDTAESFKILNRFFVDMIRPNLLKIIIAIAVMIVSSACTAGMAYLIKPLLNNVVVPKSVDNLYYISFLIMGVTLVKTVTQYIYTVILSAVGLGVTSIARMNLFDKFVNQDMYFYTKNKPGELISMMMNDVNTMSNMSTEVPINIGRDMFTFIGLMGVMLFNNFYYSLIMVGSLFFIIYPISLTSKKLKNSFKNTQFGIGTLMSQLEQIFNGIRVVKSYNMENQESIKVKNIITSILKSQKKIERIKNILPAFMEFLGAFCMAIILMYGGYQIYKGVQDPGSLFSFVASVMFAYQPIKRMSEIFFKIQFGLISAKRYYGFLDEKPILKEKENAKYIEFKSPKIELKNISFGYNAEKNAIDDVSLTANSNQKIAFVGRSGGGKSTIFNLITRFYDVKNGEILIDGINICDLSFDCLKKNIAVVSQDVVLFDSTIYENILYGNMNSTMEQVINAAKLANIDEYIQGLPQKYNTPVGVRGMSLSGGQRQRVSIARAILKNSPILLLDEATSALDSESEKNIQGALNNLMQNKTTIIIAHRISTIINCDKIYVIDKGKIVESGTHDELLKLSGMYSYLYKLQFI